MLIRNECLELYPWLQTMGMTKVFTNASVRVTQTTSVKIQEHGLECPLAAPTGGVGLDM